SALIESENSLLKKISGQFQLPHILKEITLNIESLIPDTKASILLLQADGKHVTYGAAPNLPKGYNDALEGAEIGPIAGSCGTAMFFKKSIIVTDIETDPLWVNYKNLALAYGLKACWSTPIISANGKVLGSFALYYNQVRKPVDFELTIVKQATYLTRLAIEKIQHQQKLLVAKKTIVESELKYKNLFRNNPQPMWVYHAPTLKFINVNNAALRKYGYTRKEFLQMTILDIRPETEHAKLLSSIKNRKKALQNAGIWKHQKKDGSLIDVDITSCIINATNEEILVLANDVTEKVKSEKALINREAEFRHLFETMNQGVVYQNTKGEIVKCNKAATEILGFSESALIELDSKNPVWRAIREDGTNFPGDEHPAMIALKTQKPVHNVVMGVYNPKKDDYVWILVHSELEYEQSSHILKKVVTTFTDITERNKHAQTLFKQNQLLKEIAWEQSHMVRAPLTRLMGLIQLLKEKDYSFADENDPIKNEADTINAITSTANELDEIIKNITNKTYSISKSDHS
ncbi:MAG: PAS domain S-box protein, partial [Chitinophagaceae bacterium]